jgi:alpha-galactosidase
MKNKTINNKFNLLIILALLLAGNICADRIYIGELNLKHVIQGWGQPQKDCTVENKQTLSIAGRKFTKGLGTHAPSKLQINLNGQAETFHAFVGVDDETQKKGSVEFQVYGDHEPLFKSGIIKGGDPAKEVSVKLDGVKYLTLIVTSGPDGYYHDHSNWADAWIEYEGQNPQSVAYQNPLFNVCPWPGKSDEPLAKPVSLPFTKTITGPVDDYMVVTFNSPWGREYEMKVQSLTEQGFRFVQQKGRSCMDLKPFIILFNTRTNRGTAVMLSYSGNWLLDVRPDGPNVRLLADTVPGGLDELANINGLPIPGALVTEFTGHWDYAAIPIKRFIRKNLLRKLGDDWPPVQFNDYYGTYGDMNEQLLIDVARIAARVGCELFTIDAGWYGKDKSWDACVGDWFINTDKFPNGLEPVADEVRRLGMKFGMWVEIENANPKSQLAQEHPDWFLAQSERGNRMTLNFANPQALNFAKSVVDKLMADYKLDYIKMDFNANPIPTPAPGVAGVPDTNDPLFGHYRGLIELWRHMHTAYPELIIENCSSGSLRQDLMTAAFTDTHWTSDMVTNHCNLAINFGATYLFPPEICSDWTTEPEQQENRDMLDLESRFTVNMMGHFGLSGRIWEWNDETLQTAAGRIELYKQIRPLLRSADVYHLTPQPDLDHPASIMAVQYVNEQSDESLVFVFQASDSSLKKVLPLRAVRPDNIYTVDFPKSLGGKSVKVKGQRLLEEGINIEFKQKGASAIIKIKPN